MAIHYSQSLRILHWLTLLVLVIAYTSIELSSIVDATPAQRTIIYSTHVYAGVTVLALILARLFTRRKGRQRVGDQPVNLQERAVALMHNGLYLLFILLPTLSLSARYVRGRAWSLLGIDIPVSQTPNPELAKSLMGWHMELANWGYWLIGLHALAALFHHFILKDKTLINMLPRFTHRSH